ncbi:MAG: hypothetical protein LBK99_11880 [Opitutaceae bacterium]|jgi:hypothetical protein|nr:hypothetical protein [Opitutaceae bacterium]
MTKSLRFAAIPVFAAISILKTTTHADASASAATLAPAATVACASPGFPDVPPVILFHACPQWAAARGHQDYYRYNYDRPFFLGDEPGDIWQLRTMTREVPGSVFGTYLFIQNTDRLDRLAGLFEKYLEAAKSVEGATIVPVIHAIGDKRPGKLHLLAKHLLERFATHPSWHRIKNRPIMVDYAAGGFGRSTPGELVNLITTLRAEGHRFIWLTHSVGGIGFSVNGQVDESVITTIQQAADGTYNFAQPLNHSLHGMTDLAAAIRRTPGKLYGAGFHPGYYASRLNARNYISTQGTARLRQGLEKIAITRPDFLQAATWNDWVEATSFEPSYNHTTALLEITRHYMDKIYNRPNPADNKPHVIVSYRKNIFPGEPLDFEILNLPVSPGYETITGTLALRNATGDTLVTLPWGPVSGRSAEAITVTWRVPADATRDMLTPEVTVEAAAFSQTYRQLAPVPVVTNSVQADMLYFNIPLHRLRTDAQPVLLVNNRPGQQPSVTGPRLLQVDQGQTEIPIAGISYLKNGFIINDPAPDTATRPLIDNWLSDPLHTGMVARDYYGALVGYADGTIAYASGQWAADDAWPDTIASYQFELESAFPKKKVGRDKLIDTSGHALHGTLGAPDKTARPAWKNLSDRWDALAFNGKNTFVNIPLSAMPAGPVTVQLLVRPDEESGRQQELFMQRGANLSLRITTDGKFEARRLNTRRDFDLASGATILRSGQWYHVTATYDMTRLRLYVNGVEEASVPSDGQRSPEQIRLGGPLGDTENDAIIDRTRPDSWLKGSIAYLRILDGAAKPEAIANDHRELKKVLSAIAQ